MMIDLMCDDICDMRNGTVVCVWDMIGNRGAIAVFLTDSWVLNFRPVQLESRTAMNIR